MLVTSACMIAFCLPLNNVKEDGTQGVKSNRTPLTTDQNLDRPNNTCKFHYNGNTEINYHIWKTQVTHYHVRVLHYSTHIRFIFLWYILHCKHARILWAVISLKKIMYSEFYCKIIAAKVIYLLIYDIPIIMIACYYIHQLRGRYLQYCGDLSGYLW